MKTENVRDASDEGRPRERPSRKLHQLLDDGILIGDRGQLAFDGLDTVSRSPPTSAISRGRKRFRRRGTDASASSRNLPHRGNPVTRPTDHQDPVLPQEATQHIHAGSAVIIDWSRTQVKPNAIEKLSKGT